MSAFQPDKSPLNLYRGDLREALGRGGKTLTAMRRACNEHGAGVLEAPDVHTWVWSDLHLGHGNIITYQDRPFDGLGRAPVAPEAAMNWRECPHVWINSGRVSGAVCFKGTRLPVGHLFENLLHGATVEQFLEWYPTADAEQTPGVSQWIIDGLEAARDTGG